MRVKRRTIAVPLLSAACFLLAGNDCRAQEIQPEPFPFPAGRASEPAEQSSDYVPEDRGVRSAEESPVAGAVPSGSIVRTAQVAAAVAVFGLAPGILLMTTGFVRISIVLGLLRQSLGGQNLPSAQVMNSLALFLTVLMMWPVWERTYAAAEPLVSSGVSLDGSQVREAAPRIVAPVRTFMISQLEAADGAAAVEMLLTHVSEAPQVQHYEEVPLRVLMPAFLLNELKTAFLIGFQVLLPFLVIDLLVSSVLTVAGLVMLPPNLVSFPLKLLVFVLSDGWLLVTDSLLHSFQL